MADRVRIIDIAQAAGVSKTTVSKALNNEYGINKHTKQKVLKAAHELKYRFNCSARNLKMKNRRLIGILINEESIKSVMANMGNTQKIEGIVKKAKELHYDVLIFIEDFQDTDRLITIIREKGIEGLLLVDVADSTFVDTLESYHIPVVLINWYIIGRENTLFVKTDLEESANLLVDYAVKKGYKDFGVINWEDKLFGQTVIEDAVNKRLLRYGIDINTVAWNTNYRNSPEQIKEFIESSKKRVYICFYHGDGIRVLNYCIKNGIKIPDDLAVLTYDNFEHYMFYEPKMTGIRQAFELQGEIAAEKLIGMINGKTNIKSEYVKPEFIIGDTC